MIDFPIIDSHIHLLDHQRLGYSWASGVLLRNWTADDLAKAAKPYTVEGFVFVEVDVDLPLNLDEAEWVNGLARSDKRILGCVASLPLERGPAIEPDLAGLARLPTLRGIRRLIQNQPDPEFVLKSDFLAALKLLPKYNLSFDICLFHPQLHNAIEMVRRCPEVQFVLDHIAKPGIKAGLLDPWRQHIREMAALPNVVCKLSGLTTEADRQSWTRDQLRPYIDHVIGSFGVDRVMFGGDWPVSELAGRYAQWIECLDWATSHCTPGEKRKIFRDNAIKTYRLSV